MAQTCEGVAECCVNDYETLNDAKIRVQKLAEQDAHQKSALYIKNFTKDRHFTFSEDEIAIITDSVLKFTDVQFGKAVIRANVTAQFDDDDILNWLNKYSQEKTALVAQNNELKLKIAELEQKLSKYEHQNQTKIQIKTPAKNDIDISKQKADEAWKLFCAQNYSDAIKLCDEAIQLNPNVPYFYFYRSRCYMKLGDNEKAQADFERYRKLV